jgi:hypothetical protein
MASVESEYIALCLAPGFAGSVPRISAIHG